VQERTAEVQVLVPLQAQPAHGNMRDLACSYIALVVCPASALMDVARNRCYSGWRIEGAANQQECASRWIAPAAVLFPGSICLLLAHPICITSPFHPGKDCRHCNTTLHAL